MSAFCFSPLSLVPCPSSLVPRLLSLVPRPPLLPVFWYTSFMEADGVFEGGGVKGIGLIGALKRTAEQGVEFKRVARTSYRKKKINKTMEVQPL